MPQNSQVPEVPDSGVSGGGSPPALIGSDKKVLKNAADAVAKLDVEQFIEKHLRSLFQKLEECDNYAESAPVNGDMMFMALSLPIINGVIHIASNRTTLKNAMDWVLAKWKVPHKDPDPLSILSALTLIYVVGRGWSEYKDDWETYKKRKEQERGKRSGGEQGADSLEISVPETFLKTQEAWCRISNRVKKLSEEME